uniref:CCHC-type domain-containing protein n=1 Tax=Trichogramma kaykai TaxID=54128 RepID=A0ABD2XCW1_9HYME
MNVHLISQRFLNYAYEGGGITAHFSKIDEMVNQLKQRGEKPTEKMVITKILMSLPEDYKHFISAWESVQEDQQTPTNLLARLIVAEERLKSSEKTVALTAKVKCYKCGRVGHKKNECRQNSGSNNHNEKGKQSCNYCKKQGYTIEI